MSNPTVSFRISDYHLARGLRAIRILEPTWKLTTPSDLIRTIFNDYIAKSENLNNTPHNVTTDLLQEIVYARAGISKNPLQNDQLDILPTLGQANQAKQQTQKPDWQIQRELEEERIFQEMRRESLKKQTNQDQLNNQSTEKKQSQQDSDLTKQIELSAQTSKRAFTKPSTFNDPNITESDISAVTDFSPPAEWKE